MNEIVIYHNPRCSKSRAALELLEANGVEPEVVRYLEQPPTRAELEALLGQLGLAPRDLVRRGETLFRELGLSLESPAEDLLNAMAEHPILIERPIVVRGDRAVLGRPPESVLELLR